jgi:hypothetical protein
MSRNVPKAISLCSIAFSMRVTTLCNAVSLDYLFGKHACYGAEDESSMDLPSYAYLPVSPAFSKGKKTC